MLVHDRCITVRSLKDFIRHSQKKWLSRHSFWKETMSSNHGIEELCSSTEAAERNGNIDKLFVLEAIGINTRYQEVSIGARTSKRESPNLLELPGYRSYGWKHEEKQQWSDMQMNSTFFRNLCRTVMEVILLIKFKVSLAFFLLNPSLAIL